VDNNSNVEGIAENLKYYLLYGDINLINTEIDLYHSISREEIRSGKKYLNESEISFGLHPYLRDGSELSP
jgi:hypothetical protein